MLVCNKISTTPKTNNKQGSSSLPTNPEIKKYCTFSVPLKAAAAPTNSKLVNSYCYVLCCFLQKCLFVTDIYLIMPVMPGFKA